MYASAVIQGFKNKLADVWPAGLSSERSVSSEMNLIKVNCFPTTTRNKKKLHFHLLKNLKYCYSTVCRCNFL